MELKRHYFQSRVARRFFLSFMLSALLPLAIFFLLSSFYVVDLLDSIDSKRIEETSKGTGMAITRHLRLLEEELKLFSNSRLEKRDNVHSDNLIPVTDELITTVGAIFSTNLVPSKYYRYRATDIELPHLTTEQQHSLAKGRSAILFGHPVEQRPYFFILRAIDPERLNLGLIWAIIDIEIIRTIGEEQAVGPVFCVADESLNPLFCSSQEQQSLISSLSYDLSIDNRSTVSRNYIGEEFLIGYWKLFLPALFESDSWIVVVGYPKDYWREGIVGFLYLVIPVVILTGLLVTISTMRQVRSRLAPLETLRDATGKISTGDFDRRVRLTSGDEFEELANDFNHMAEKLGAQFNSLNALIELDKAILSSLDINLIIEIVLHRLNDTAHFSSPGFLLIERFRKNKGTLFHLHGKESPIEETSINLNEEFIERSNKPANSMNWFEENPSLLFSPCPQDTADNHACIVPVLTQQRLTGFFIFFNESCADASQEASERLLEYANHVAIAIGNAQWEEDLYHQAHYDPLTGLPNRALLYDRLDQATRLARRNNHHVAVCFLDIDLFKNINDSFGHNVGDLYLIELGKRLSSSIRQTDTIVRFAGDEFVILMPEIPPHKTVPSVLSVVEKIQNALKADFVTSGYSITPSLSIGIAIFPKDAEDTDSLLKCADTAMYHAKENKRGEYQFYSHEMNRVMVERLIIEQELQIAIRDEQFYLTFQPQVDALNGKITGAETLIRWRHPEKGMISPEEFIPIAEDSGLINEIGDWIINKACIVTKQMIDENKSRPFRMSINISAQQFEQGEALIQTLNNAIEQSGLDHKHIEIEVTEGILMKDFTKTIEILKNIRKAGVTVAVDDFGTGYSSLNYLRKLPIDVLKIDKSFTQEMQTHSTSAAIVSMIIQIAHLLKLRVIAEGVETKHQCNALLEEGCTHHQGYFYGKPMNLANLRKLLAENSVTPSD
ncbi:EAL domain-containing protein [endosymbiont of Lamellibrachia barhami]|uniref:EAL domain-containing protein n=1 Tax=endosymbiont of Lamellibrachia barhami TaxID=205975 RepID=UPI0015AE3BD0|nr:EAL domain-containing protein [endosymbiont of Lamellibrachia barhami]